jgi:hypothetical protein
MIDEASRALSAMSWGQRALLTLGVFSLTLALSLGAVIAVLVRLPATYFRDDDVSASSGRHPIVRGIALILKNMVGALVILLGLFLSLPGIPGQGMLTILIGVMLLNFPGKRRLERWLVSRPRVLPVINRLRARFGKPPLLLA